MKPDAKDYLEAKVCEISDPDFQSLVTCLCDCIGLAREDFMNQRFSFLLMAIGKEKRETRLFKKYLAVEGVLGWKLDKLDPNSVIYEVCKQLATANNTFIEAFGGASVLTLIKKTYKRFCPATSTAKKLKKYQLEYQRRTALIDSRRRNGSL